MIRRILLDLDDVCNSLTLHIMRHVGCPVRSYADYPVECGYDILCAVNKTHPSRNNWTVPEFWDCITRRVWSAIPESYEFRWLLEYCENAVGRENICILTSPTKDGDCHSGKYEWIMAHFPEWMHRQYLIGPRKYFCAHPDALLIDDSDHNVEQFRRWGGQAILVPRPWNRLHDCDTATHVAAQFTQFEFANHCKPIPFFDRIVRETDKELAS